MTIHPRNILNKKSIVVIVVALAISVGVILIKEQYFRAPASENLAASIGTPDVIYTGYFAESGNCIIDEIIFKKSNINFPNTRGGECPAGAIPIDRYAPRSGEGAVFFIRGESAKPYKTYSIENGKIPEYSGISVGTFKEKLVEITGKQLTN